MTNKEALHIVAKTSINPDEIANAQNKAKEDKDMTDSKALTFEINGTTYSTKDRTGNYFYKTINGQKVRIKEAEFAQALAQATALETPAELTDNGLVDCRNCPMKDTCIHHDAMRRNPVEVGGLALCPRLGVDTWEAEADAEKKAREDKIEADAKEAEAAVAKKTKKKAKKNVAFRFTEMDGTETTLTEKQVDFIRHLPDTCFYENGVDSALWIDVLTDEIGGQFANKPMTVGAMVSTLREKGIVQVGEDRINGRKCKFMTLSELGKIIALELGLN